jgi:succinoglycan biosynthesis transport protein ExoP
MQKEMEVIKPEIMPSVIRNADTGKKINPVMSVKNHLPKVLLISFICMAIGLTFIYLKVSPLYQAEAKIVIEPVIPKILYGKEQASITNYYDNFANTQINIMQSFPVLSEALNIYKEKGFVWKLPGETTQGAVTRLQTQLKINQVRNTHLISVEKEGRTKEGLAELVNAVVQSYMEIGDKDQSSKDSSRLHFLENRKKEMDEELKKRYLELERVAKKHAVGTTDERNIYVYLEAVVNVQQSLIKARARRIEMEVRLKELSKQMKKLKTLDISAEVEEWVEHDEAIEDNRIQMSRRLQGIGLTFEGMKEEHPDRLRFEKSFEKLLEVQTTMRERAHEKATSVIRGKLLAVQKKKILELEADYAAALKTEKKLLKELGNAEKKATNVNSKMIRASTFRRDIKRIQDAQIRIDERIDELEVESRSPGRIFLMDKALMPEMPSTKKRTKFFIVAIIFSVIAGVGYAVGRDKLDTQIKTTEDIENVLNFPPTGYILDTKDMKIPADRFDRLALDFPQSMIAEQIRDITFSLSQEQENYKSKIFTWFSLEKNHGTTSVLSNVLCSLSGKSSKKIYVDLNIWNPVTSSLENSNQKGLWDVMEGKCSLREAIIENNDLPFHVLPIGNLGNQSPNFFSEAGLESIIRTLTMDYQYIMIDAPPLMFASEVKFLTRLADVSVLVVKAGEVTEQQLLKSVKQLERINVQILSVILNGVKLFRGGYYKSQKDNYQEIAQSKTMEDLNESAA